MVGPQSYTAYENKPELDERLKCKARNHKTPRRTHGQRTLTSLSAASFGIRLLGATSNRKASAQPRKPMSREENLLSGRGYLQTIRLKRFTSKIYKEFVQLNTKKKKKND